MNVRKLRKLQEWILEEPKRFDMTCWVNPDEIVKRNPPCGTVGCLAGMACHMEGNDINKMAYMDFPNRARQILGLTFEESEKLFYLPSMHEIEEGWPKKFDRAYIRAKTLLGKARVAACRIDHFIATKGAE